MAKKSKSPFKIDKEKYYFQKYGNIKPKLFKRLKLWIYGFGLHAVAVYRLGQYGQRLKKRSKLLSLPVRILHFMLEYQIISFRHILISGHANIGPGFYIPRGYNINIPGINIGENFTVHHNVTIGTDYTSEGRPSIGNHVWIGTGVIIAGPISVGDNVTISAGCILSKDAPDGCLLGGNPGRVLIKDHDNSRWMRYSGSQS